MKYAVWNNKGGVGKSYLTFLMGTEYALAHQDKRVILLDLCPQANLSEIILGGNGTGSANLANVLREAPRRSVGGYFDARIESPQRYEGSVDRYLMGQVLRTINTNLPRNLWFVAGDPSLEIQAQAISNIGQQPLPADSWRNVHSWLIDLIKGIERLMGEEAVFFMDCNPSFATYTELAILAADRLIVPCTADGSSARGIDNIGRLVYGRDVPRAYRTVNFNRRARDADFELPAIHLICLNRSTQFQNRAAKAFGLMMDEIRRRANLLESNEVEFTMDRNHRFFDVPDMHTASVVCSYEGIPLSQLRVGLHVVDDENVMINAAPLQTYQQAVSTMIGML